MIYYITCVLLSIDSDKTSCVDEKRFRRSKYIRVNNSTTFSTSPLHRYTQQEQREEETKLRTDGQRDGQRGRDGERRTDRVRDGEREGGTDRGWYGQGPEIETDKRRDGERGRDGQRERRTER